MINELTISHEKNLPITISTKNIERAKDFIKNQHAASTRRIYGSDLKLFKAWCLEKGLDCLPATPQTVVLFLSERADAGIRPATLSVRVASIKYWHNIHGVETPTNSEIVRAALKGIRRTYGVAQKKKAPVTVEILGELLRHVPNSLQGIRDRALILLGFAGAFRRSELAALSVDDLQESEMGLKITIRKSKTDQEGMGQVIAIYGGHRLKVIEAVKEWIDVAKITTGPLFRNLRKGGNVMDSSLSTKSVAQIIKKYAALAGLKEAQFSGHSLRAGFVTSAAERGANLFKIMDVTRHKKVDTLKGYVRHVDMFKDHCGASFL